MRWQKRSAGDIQQKERYLSDSLDRGEIAPSGRIYFGVQEEV
jgi:hypothetical protein